MDRVAPPAEPDFISDTQTRVLNSLFDVATLNKMDAMIARFGSKAMPLEDYVSILHHNIWHEFESAKPLKLDRYRRNLQKAYLGNIIGIMTTKQGEATESDFYSVIRVDLDKLRIEIKKAIPRAGDKMTSYHLKDMDQRIESLLKPNSST